MSDESRAMGAKESSTRRYSSPSEPIVPGPAGRGSGPPAPQEERPATSASEKDRFCLYDDGEIEQLPDPSWLIEEIIPNGGLGILVARPKSYKTFLALDWSLRIATGRSWASLEVEQGPVVYISAEGQAGIKLRVRAWKEEHGCEIGKRAGKGVHFLMVPVQLRDADDVGELIRTIATELPKPPKLIVIDTLARCIPGAEENAAKDVGEAIESIDRLREAFGCTVLVIHHTPRNGASHPRGSSSLDGAADTVMSLKKFDKGKATLRCTMQKDAAAFDAIGIELVERGESLVVEPMETATDGPDLIDRDWKALAALVQVFDGGAAFSEWMEVTGMPKTTFNRAREKLLAQALVTEEDDLYFPADEGQEALEECPIEVPELPDTDGSD